MPRPDTVPASGRPIVRDRILEAAYRDFDQHGYRGAKVSRIARAAGIAPATLYFYFDGKEGLFAQVVDRATEQWIAIARDVAARPLPALERLVLLGQASVGFSQESNIHRGILSRDDQAIFGPLLDAFYMRLCRATIERIAQILREGIDEGTIRSVDVDKTAVLLFVGGNALMDQQLLPYEEVLPLYEELVLKGLTR